MPLDGPAAPTRTVSPNFLARPNAQQRNVGVVGMTLTAFDEIASLGRGDELEAAFTNFKTLPSRQTRDDLFQDGPDLWRELESAAVLAK
jgi:hypothetical protein